jgi:hypothetical protein
VVVAVAEVRELSPRVPVAPLGPAMTSTSSIFKMEEDAKAVHIYTGDPAKTV